MMDTEFDADTLLDLVNDLIQKYPDLKRIILEENGEMTDHINIILNNKPISLIDGFETRLVDGDELLFMLPISGG